MMLLLPLAASLVFINLGFALPVSVGLELEEINTTNTTTTLPEFTFPPCSPISITILPGPTLRAESDQEALPPNVEEQSNTLPTTPNANEREESVSWINPVTYTIICYDFFIASVFVWCWIQGCFWWWRKENVSGLEGGYEMEDLGTRGGGGGRRARSEREREIEREMRRLGMI
ncbi:uncharacterized protein K460DRAFT_75922 [Cucurbitaria berberidis CBS 394.84]|uniref:Transmembrane protein n=1 Tax=Cucurbitaria berberidis CBS 394.84 TaxID=1168544 RepID=A0A9P4GNH3_9PLEO|nr:uncharacterized protein K460DRAFT_75922 [Cucurbitaria berberidis CBS 394.84]KAF1848506.1 hypothetical protein K460DRAFT_75922 [Cucurbitaria berberidis CBS 394.84]